MPVETIVCELSRPEMVLVDEDCLAGPIPVWKLDVCRPKSCPLLRGRKTANSRTWRRIDPPSRIREYQALWDDNADYLLGYLHLIDVKPDERNTDCSTRAG